MDRVKIKAFVGVTILMAGGRWFWSLAAGHK